MWPMFGPAVRDTRGAPPRWRRFGIVVYSWSMTNAVVPHGENLRRAIRWLSDRGRHDIAAINDAAERFDLTPLEEEFLIKHFSSESHNGSD